MSLTCTLTPEVEPSSSNDWKVQDFQVTVRKKESFLNVKKHFIKLLNSNKKQKCLKLRWKIQVFFYEFQNLSGRFGKVLLEGGEFQLSYRMKKIFFWLKVKFLIFDNNRAFSKKILENITLVIEEMDGENREFE